MTKLFILGFTKCATTSLYDSLILHPKVNNSGRKEPHYYFSQIEGHTFNGVADADTVKQMFVTSKDKYEKLDDHSKINIDASAMSINNIKVLELIRQENPHAKAIIVLRCPIERAFSAYSHMVRDVRETLTFKEAIKEELNGKRKNHLPIWHYIDSSRYVERVYAARELFEDDLLILDYEDLKLNYNSVMDQIAEFIEIDKINWKKSTSNKSGNPKSKLIQRVLMRDSFVKRVFVKVNPRRLTSYFKSILLRYNTAKKQTFSNDEKILVADSLKSELGKIKVDSRDYQVLSNIFKTVKALNED